MKGTQPGGQMAGKRCKSNWQRGTERSTGADVKNKINTENKCEPMTLAERGIAR